MDVPPPPLDYNSRPVPVNWRPLLWSLAILSAGFLVVLILQGPVTRLYQQHQRKLAINAMLQLQEACLKYSIPPGTLVFDHSPGTAATLQQLGYARVTASGRRTFSEAAVTPSPTLKLFQDSAVALNDRNWGYNPIESPGDGVVFMHERNTPSGQPVLIVAFVYTDGAPDPRYEPWYELRIFRLIPATPTSPPRGADNWYNLDVSLQRPADGILQIRAGIPDNQDRSHFVIPILKGGKSIDLHCWLKEDFKIKVRAKDGVVKQDNRCTSSAVYWSWPESVTRTPDYHEGLD